MRKVARAFIALAFLSTVAVAASPEADYLAARDKAIASLKADKDQTSDAAIAREQAARQALAVKLRALLGPVSVKGFEGAGETNPDTLLEGDEGFGALDGLTFLSSDNKASLLVSTVGLTRTWLAAHRHGQNLPQEIGAALKSDGFYTAGMDTDAAVAIYADLPITKPPEAGQAAALLIVRRQDIIHGPPDEIIGSVVVGDKLLVAHVPLADKAPTIAACETLWNGYKRKIDAAKDSSALEEKGDAAFRHCYGERFAGEKSSQAVVQQAQGLIERLSAH
jgi:hypothetical protein